MQLLGVENVAGKESLLPLPPQPLGHGCELVNLRLDCLDAFPQLLGPVLLVLAQDDRLLVNGDKSRKLFESVFVLVFEDRFSLSKKDLLATLLDEWQDFALAQLGAWLRTVLESYTDWES